MNTGGLPSQNGEALMEKMKKLLAVTILAVIIFVPALCSEAVMKITFINRTDRDVYVALYVENATRGWYHIAPGATWVYELRENVWNVGYYAEGRAYGRRTIYWEGGLFRGWIHQTEPFNIRRQTRQNRPLGGRQVGFRHIALIREKDFDERITNFVATVTLVENPQVGNPGATE